MNSVTLPTHWFTTFGADTITKLDQHFCIIQYTANMNQYMFDKLTVIEIDPI
jgi:hypothetical protein